MIKYVKVADNMYYDNCCCYKKDGTCVCVECMYFGPNRVNCGFIEEDYSPFDKYVWDATSKEFVKENN